MNDKLEEAAKKVVAILSDLSDEERQSVMNKCEEVFCCRCWNKVNGKCYCDPCYDE